MRRLALIALLAGCAAQVRPADAPPEAPDEVEVVRGDRFTLWVERGAIDTPRQAALLRELTRASDAIAAWLGPGARPGDFRAAAQRRPLDGAPACPEVWEFGPSPALPHVDVVVRADGERCHADRHGLVLVRRHLDRRDATHELVHWLAGASWRPVDEGLATWLTEATWGPDRTPVALRARAYLDLALDREVTPDLRPETMTRRDYDIAAAFVGWLVDTFGKPRFLELYHGPPRNYHGVYGQSEADLWRRFWRHIRGLDVRHDGRFHQFKTDVSASMR